MIKSMTGFAQHTFSLQENGQRDLQIVVELKSVNHRFCEIAMRAPKSLSFMEEQVKRIIKEKMKRGRIDVTIALHTGSLAKKKLNVDIELAKSYIDALHRLKQELALGGEITIQELLAMEDIFQIEEEDINVKQVAELLEQAVRDAVSQLLEMRVAEGAALASDLKRRVAEVENTLERLKELAPQVKKEYMLRLQRKIEDLLEHREALDESRLLQEVVIFGEKSDINEELTRLSSHCRQFIHILSIEEPVGRKLDFLIQEMNREINTIGSKANHIQISQWVVELKSSVEKMKEQVQNIE